MDERTNLLSRRRPEYPYGDNPGRHERSRHQHAMVVAAHHHCVLFWSGFLMAMLTVTVLVHLMRPSISLLPFMMVSPNHWGASSQPPSLMYPVVTKSDHGIYLEYSVIHTDRSLNLMSQPFQQVMRDLNMLFKTTYNAEKVVIIPGSGTFGMEAVARQFATAEHVMVLRNGYFSYRWSEIFEFGYGNNNYNNSVEHGGIGKGIPSSHSVLLARPVDQLEVNHWNSTPSPHNNRQYIPCPVDEVVRKIYEEQPRVVFAPHVETSTGIILPDHYLKAVAEAVHNVGGLLVLDCIASGSTWVDMKAVGVDVLLSAPQKSWTAPPCAALVMLSQQAHQVMLQRPGQESSFAMSMTRWSAVMDAYENGSFAYHTTPPTDALRDLQQVSVEMLHYGLDKLQRNQYQLGTQARTMMASKLVSVAAPGFEAPSVLVFYAPPVVVDNTEMVDLFHRHGLQIAMGIPWKLGEPEGLHSFRIGLFGIDKLKNMDRTVSILEAAVDHVLKDVH